MHPGEEYGFEKRPKTKSLSELLGVSTGAAATNGAAGIPLSEVKKHKSKDSAWVVLHGNVYDLTAFLEDHPGGPEVVLDWAGRDATKYWSAIHQKDWIAEYVKPEWCLGPVGLEPKRADDEQLKQLKDENAK